MVAITTEVRIMDRLNNIHKKLLVQAVASFTIFFSTYSTAGISGDAYWIVEKGDNLYSIARNVFPGDKDKQRQFRKELISGNAALLKGKPGVLHIGDKLALPAFAISKPVQVEEKVESVQAEPVVDEKPEVITPDPEEVIGHVVISVGRMQASNRGNFRDLLRNSKVFKGDTITTASNSYTQVRMKDGALLSLRPNTQLVITDYNFNGKEDGTEKSFMELVRGGFRTITGYIGHKNKRNYRVKTAVATIGIRGTHYGLMVCSDDSCKNEAEPMEDGVYGGVVDGSINVSNESGEYIFNNDQYFHVASVSSAAVEQLVPPPVFHGNSEKPFSEKNRESKQAKMHKESVNEKKREIKNAISNRAKLLDGDIDHKKARGNRLGTLVMSYIDNEAEPLVLPDQVNDAIKDKPTFVPAPDGSAALIGLLGTNINGQPDQIAGSVIVAPVTNGSIILGSKLSPEGFVINNIPVAMREVSNNVVHEVFLPSATAGVDFIAGDPIGVNWGRWTDNYVITENGTPLPSQGDLHYIYSDKITSPTQIAALGGLIANPVTYTLVGGTSPTTPAGNELILGSLTMTADFTAQAMVNYNVTISDPLGPSTFNMISTQPIPFNAMDSFTLTSPNCPACAGNASAAFVGNQAQGVITTYSLRNTATPAIGATGSALLVRP